MPTPGRGAGYMQCLDGPLLHADPAWDRGPLAHISAHIDGEYRRSLRGGSSGPPTPHFAVVRRSGEHVASLAERGTDGGPAPPPSPRSSRTPPPSRSRTLSPAGSAARWTQQSSAASHRASPACTPPARPRRATYPMGTTGTRGASRGGAARFLRRAGLPVYKGADPGDAG